MTPEEQRREQWVTTYVKLSAYIASLPDTGGNKAPLVACLEELWRNRPSNRAANSYTNPMQ